MCSIMCVCCVKLLLFLSLEPWSGHAHLNIRAHYMTCLASVNFYNTVNEILEISKQTNNSKGLWFFIHWVNNGATELSTSCVDQWKCLTRAHTHTLILQDQKSRVPRIRKRLHFLVCVCVRGNPDCSDEAEILRNCPFVFNILQCSNSLLLMWI